MLRIDSGDRLHGWIWSPLFAWSSPWFVRIYLISGVLACGLLMSNFAGRWLVVLTSLFILGLVHRTATLQGAGEHLIAATFLYLCIHPGSCWFDVVPAKSLGTARTPHASSWSSHLALQLIRVHLWAWLVLGLASQSAGVLWWQGEAAWWFLACRQGMIGEMDGWAAQGYAINLLTHAMTGTQVLAVATFWSRWRMWGWVSAMFFWILVGMVAGQWMYALAGAAMTLAFWEPRRKAEAT
jgi:hypothetical protein